MSQSILEKLKPINGYPCVSIILPTHRKAPENQQDAIRLKNLIKETHNRLEEEFSKRELQEIYANLDKLVDSIDHEHNKEALALFINKEVAEFVRLPLKVEQRVVIDKNFATRDLLRELQLASHYYILALQREQVHLFEVVGAEGHEIKQHGFPMKSKTTDVSDQGQIENFFNVVDKHFYEVYKDQPADLVIAGIERNVTHYMKVADHKDIILTTFSSDHDQVEALIEASLPKVKALQSEKQQEQLAKLEQAVSQQKFTDNLIEIWKMVNQGRGDTLFVEKGYYQAAKVENGSIELVEDASAPGVVDDIVDEITELTTKMGGKVVFMDNGKLEKFQRIALIDRF